MSKQKAMEFLMFLESSKEFQEKANGFTDEELNEAAGEMLGELADSELNSVSGGRGRVPFSSSGWIKYFIEKARREAQEKR